MGEKEKKILFYTLLAAAGVGALALGIKFIKNKISSNAQKEANNVDKSKMTITESQAKMIAQNIYNAMKDTGTDEDVIKMQLAKLKTADDWKAVNVAFGTPDYAFYGAPFFNIGGDPLNMLGWFKKELSSSLYEEVEKKFSEYGLYGVG